MNLVSIITPVAPYHTDLLSRCATSVEAQTILCTHIIIHDIEGRGAGWARNAGLRQVETDFVVFLDADDQLNSHFVEACLNAYDERHYIYCDWWQDEQLVTAPECAWKGQAWHCITALLPTAWVNYVGGFDERLTAGEDTHFYMKLTRGGMCGKRLDMPLFHYGKEGQRSRNFMGSAAYHTLMKQLSDEFGDKRMTDNCIGCGGFNADIPQQPTNQQQPGMVLAKAAWGGNRQERGRVTGVLYPRAGNGSQLWVYPEDAHAAPHLFQVIRPTLPVAPPPAPRKPVLPKIEPEPTPEPVPVLNGAAEVAEYVNEHSAPVGATPQALPVEAVAAASGAAPDVQRVIKKAQRGKRR